MTYYAQRKSILNGEPQIVNNRYGDRRAMERKVYSKHIDIEEVETP